MKPEVEIIEPTNLDAEVTTTVQKVLEAAEQGPLTKATMMKLFPDVFKSKAVPYGTFTVEALPTMNLLKGSRYTAITGSLLEAYKEEHGYSNLSVVVLCSSNNAESNGWSYGKWETFYQYWKPV